MFFSMVELVLPKIIFILGVSIYFRSEIIECREYKYMSLILVFF